MKKTQKPAAGRPVLFFCHGVYIHFARVVRLLLQTSHLTQGRGFESRQSIQFSVTVLGWFFVARTAAA